MRQKQVKINAFLLLGIGLTGLQAQNIYVNPKTGNQTIYPLNNIQKINFSQASMQVHKTTGNPDTYALSGLKYVSFSGATTSIAETNNTDLDILAYPNPFSDVLNIKIPNETGNCTIDIFSLEGRLILSKQMSGLSDFTIKVNELEPGIYLCRYTSGKQSKTIKISKQ